MNVTAHLKFDRHYFESKYDDWLRYRARWRKYSVPFSILLIVLASGVCYGFRDQWMFGGFMVLGGVFELVSSITYKRRWVNRCLRMACANREVEIRFEVDSIETNSSNGKSVIKTSSLDSLVPASNGFFLVPDNQLSIYIPRYAVDPAEKYQPLVESLTEKIGAR